MIIEDGIGTGFDYPLHVCLGGDVVPFRDVCICSREEIVEVLAVVALEWSQRIRRRVVQAPRMILEKVKSTGLKHISKVLKRLVTDNFADFTNRFGCAFAGFFSAHFHHFSEIVRVIVDLLNAFPDRSGKGDHIFGQLLFQIPVTNGTIVITGSEMFNGIRSG